MAQINKPSDYFNTKLYTGNGSTQSITGVGFQPDWVWCKARSYNDSHFVFDEVRGATKNLQTNSTSVEVTNANSLTAFGTDGFTLGSDGGANSNGDTYASWNWLGANGTTSNTDGSITSTVSANTTSGFSIVTYTGSGSNPATIGHGLGAVPKVILLKKRTGASALSWKVYNEEIGNANYLILDSTSASASDSTIWNSTTPSSSVFTVGSSDTNNTDNYVAYCFAEKKGFSKFGSYAGNSSTDGTFVYTGFKPAFVLFKSTDGTESWSMVDNKRDTFNVVKKQLFPNLSNAAETTNNVMDFCSNGFKLRNSDTRYNYSSYTYIYMAFAENPLVGTNNIPATAR